MFSLLSPLLSGCSAPLMDDTDTDTDIHADTGQVADDTDTDTDTDDRIETGEPDSDADTDTDVDTDEAMFETFPWDCASMEADRSYVHRFGVRFDVGEALEAGMWTVYDDDYVQWSAATYGIELPTAIYVDGVSLDEDGYVLGYCIWLAADGFEGWATDELILVVTW